MSEYKQLSFEDAAVKRIYSLLRTLIRYHNTSIALHGRPTASEKSIGMAQEKLVSAIQDLFPDSARIAVAAFKWRITAAAFGILDEDFPGLSEE